MAGSITIKNPSSKFELVPGQVRSEMSRVTPDFMLVRLRNQRLVGPRFKSAADVVGWFGAVQAQDYGGAKWALALRTRGLRNRDVERAYAEGHILRTHVLRPTWHFVLPADL